MQLQGRLRRKIDANNLKTGTTQKRCNFNAGCDAKKMQMILKLKQRKNDAIRTQNTMQKRRK